MDRFSAPAELTSRLVSSSDLLCFRSSSTFSSFFIVLLLLLRRSELSEELKDTFVLWRLRGWGGREVDEVQEELVNGRWTLLGGEEFRCGVAVLE